MVGLGEGIDGKGDGKGGMGKLMYECVFVCIILFHFSDCLFAYSGCSYVSVDGTLMLPSKPGSGNPSLNALSVRWWMGKMYRVGTLFLEEVSL